MSGSGDAGSCNTSRNSVRIETKASYLDSNLTFQDSHRISLPTRLSDSLTYLRMAFTSDGKILAAGGEGPLVIYKTRPAFENLQVHKESRRITALDFPISSTSSHLVMSLIDFIVHT
jgi:hypothetical protein